MKLIGANNLITCLQIMSTKNDSTVWEQCIEIVNSLPDEQKHGKWIRIDGKDYWKCSCCKEENAYAYALNDDSLILQDKYCPNCGAKMDEE